jgi:polysaccharide biosynthesis protein PslG
MNSTSGTMPSFRVGSVRFWDSETRWTNLEPEWDQYSWFTLDRLVAGANQAGLPALFVLGGTPAWAAPNGPKTAYPDNSRTAPPDNLTDWDLDVIGWSACCGTALPGTTGSI